MIIKIGIDLNGVLANNKLPYIKTKKFSIFSVVEDSIKIVQKIVKIYGKENVFIVSRAQSHQLAFITGIWMEVHNFLQKTNIPLDNIKICTRLKDKAEIAKKLNITHFIDDRPEVLNYFPENITLIAYQPKINEIKKYPKVASRVVIVNSWKEIANYFKIPL